MLTYPGRSSQNLWNKKSGYDETAIKILALDWQLISRALRFDKTREVGLSGRVAEVINESLDTIEPEHLEIVSTVQCLNMFPWEATFWFHRWLTINEFNSFRRLGLNYSKSNWDTRITPGRNTVRYDLSGFYLYILLGFFKRCSTFPESLAKLWARRFAAHWCFVIRAYFVIAKVSIHISCL